MSRSTSILFWLLAIASTLQGISLNLNGHATTGIFCLAIGAWAFDKTERGA